MRELRRNAVNLRWGGDRDVIRYYGAANGEAFLRTFPRYAIKVGERNGAIVGVGGLGWTVDGECIAFADCSGMRFAKSMHRAATEILELGRQFEMKIVAFRQDLPTSERWLKRLGFEPAGMDGDREVWVWER